MLASRENPSFWPKTLSKACFYAHHLSLHTRGEEDITCHFLWQWGKYHPDVWPIWERIFDQGRDDDGRFEPDIFSLLQRALTEGQEDDRIFALFLLGTLGTSEARDLLISFLNSEHRKERWASAIMLGRLKEERVFPLLQTFLLESFAASEIPLDVEETQKVQEGDYLSQKATEEEREAEDTEERRYLESIDYEWYLRQRSECALILGTWGNPVVIPKLRKAFQAAWRMEQDWPNYQGANESGPIIWYFFQDRLAFALGQLGDWDALLFLRFPAIHLLVARIYLILGHLQIGNPGIFWGNNVHKMFHEHFVHRQNRIEREKAGLEVDPFIESEQVKPLLAVYFGLSPEEQEDYLVNFPKAWYERAKESQAILKVQRRRYDSTLGDTDPFLGS